MWIFSVVCRAPVKDAHESPEECYQEAEVAMTPDPDREGKEHDPDVRDVGEAVEEDHPVHQRVLLDFEPDKDNDIDDKDGEIVCYECEKIKYWSFPIKININCIFEVKR